MFTMLIDQESTDTFILMQKAGEKKKEAEPEGRLRIAQV